MVPEPLLSVVMPVRNVEVFVGASIQSILEQTFEDFELVILDDASTDNTAEIVRDWARQDDRIKFFQSPNKLGLSGSSNAVVSHARAPIIARMDGDDISLPDRLRRQWEILETSDDVVLVGTLSSGMNAEGSPVRPRDRWRLLRHSPFAPFPHGSVMFRRKAFADVGGYCASHIYKEDQDLYSRMATKGKILVIPDVLYLYRYHVNCSSLIDVDDVSTPLKEQINLQELYARGALRLWSGDSPSVLRQIPLRLQPNTARILIWALWGELNPSTLRLGLRWFIRTRDLFASIVVKNGRPREWRFEQ